MFKSVINVVILIAITLLFTIACVPKAEARKLVYTEGWKQNGITSFYHRSLNGNLTANGERYRHFGEMTAAHRHLPFGTKVQVTDKNTGKSIVVRINDRGPFHGNRVLDLSGKAAQRLGILKRGVCNVEVKVISLPEKYMVKTKQMPKTIVPKAKPNLGSNIDSELANVKATPKAVFTQSRIDSIEELLSNVVQHN